MNDNGIRYLGKRVSTEVPCVFWKHLKYTNFLHLLFIISLLRQRGYGCLDVSKGLFLLTPKNT